MGLTPKLTYVFIYTCNGKYSKKDIKRFIKYIKIDTSTGDYIWNGNRDKDNYGKFYANGKHHRAHRAAYEIATGEIISKELLSCHECDHTFCVNPKHLTIGTQKKNINDMIFRGRRKSTTGDNCPVAKLNSIEIKEIRMKWNTGDYSQKRLAIEYNISRAAISDIVCNKKWYDKIYIKKHISNKSFNRK